LRPTEYAFRTAMKLVVEAYDILGDNFPKASTSTDDLGTIAILNHLHNSCRGNPTPTPRGCPIPRRAGTGAPPLHICMNDLGLLY